MCEMMKMVTKKRVLLLLLCLLMILLFFTAMPIFTFDSCWYLGYLDYFYGERPLNEWFSGRGYTFPLILLLARTIKKGVYGIEIVLCLFYLVYCFYAYKSFKLLKNEFLGKELIIIDYFLLVVIMYLNPIIWGYFHTVLTDGVSLSFLLMYFYYALRFFCQRLTGNPSRKKYFMYLVFSAITTIVLWNLKQSFFVCTVFVGGIFEFSLLIKKKKKLDFVYLLLFIFVIFSSLIASTKLWNHVIQNTSDEYQGGLANNISKVRYFPWIADEGIYTIISVRDDNYREIDTFKYAFDYGLTSRIQFVVECFKRNPERLLQGYIDNYLVIADLYRIPPVTEGPVSYTWGRVDKSSFLAAIDNNPPDASISVENRTIVQYRMDQEIDYEVDISNRYELLTADYVNSSIKHLPEYYYTRKPNLFTSIMANEVLWDVWQCVFSLLIVASPFAFIVCFIKLILSKASVRTVAIMTLSFYAFLLVVMYVFFSVAIDRYGLPSFCAMCMVLLCCLCGMFDKTRVRFKENNTSKCG